ncbi:hypothetical protein NAEGRDRAFT_67958 [Naegleria gruberi]|uniref:Uncharacterized protein AM8 n=1 Tax=Naegleria gruberi TaxID=5762 RepID=D2VGF5_NAEGR|nr:uncharacterized protein NAEGRDRAFT_67958 [Naegleria gruberi]EFC44054.1 hypothetical protein NAEGRDRAFT_67958 [Naegleria gruberi]|eukprot:XP_002676798.1 hypothetical protein NAEGRDRAFT_67958 [Naegleria gruberi strain NEG-M]
MFRFFGSSALPEDDTTSLDNYNFYINKLRSRPQGDLIENIHKNWFGDWDLLEEHHAYIQYLFPIRLQGMNASSQPLTKHEASLLRSDAAVKARIIQSYRLMLDFYGLVLEDEVSGKISRNPVTYKKRYSHLNSSFHNYLRITRIMKCLGVTGFEHYKPHFLNHMVVEMFKYNNLQNARDSLIKFWLPTLRKEEHLQYFDNLVDELSQGKRKVNREGRDGYGDEVNDQSWQTEYYDSNFNVDFADPYFANKDVLTHANDPYASNQHR